MKRLLLILTILVLCPFILCAGTDEDMFNKAHELSYEGQIETARKLLEAEDGSGAESAAVGRPAPDDGWDGTSLFLGIIWGAVGSGYFIYGKKAARAGFLLCGIGLVLLPMFVSSVIYNAVIGIALSVIPFKVEI
ncbi:MAG: hypothetical protein GX569_14580 [Candidatus Riflebacteria bacterium]|nr:hypothetical protein [Candidatus Riflebacteria bacterium]